MRVSQGRVPIHSAAPLLEVPDTVAEHSGQSYEPRGINDHQQAGVEKRARKTQPRQHRVSFAGHHTRIIISPAPASGRSLCAPMGRAVS